MSSSSFKTALFPLAALLSLLTMPLPASALPVAEVLDLETGAERFLRVDPDPVALVEPEGLVTFEPLPSGEAFVSAKKAGRGILFVSSQKHSVFQAVRLRIRGPGQKKDVRHHTDAEFDAARKACPSMVVQNTSYGLELEADVQTLECRNALLPVVSDDAFIKRNVAFTFSGSLMQEQLKVIVRRLEALGLTEDKLRLSYLGVTLVLQGRLTAEERMLVLKTAWEETLGTFLFDDRTERLPSAEQKMRAPDGPGASEPPAAVGVESIEQLQKEHPELFEGAAQGAAAGTKSAPQKAKQESPRTSAKSAGTRPKR